MQNRERTRKFVVAVISGDAVRPRHLRPTAKGVIAESKRPRPGVRKRRQPVKRVIAIGVRATVGRVKPVRFDSES